MKIYRNYRNIPNKEKGKVIAIGNFDGLHKGHRSLLSLVKDQAIINKGEINDTDLSAVLTFEPHPLKIIMPSLEIDRILSFRLKVLRLESLGINTIFSIRFDKNLSFLTAQEFIEKVLISSLNAKHIIVGYDFRFGKKRKGDTKLLEEFANDKQFGLTVLDPVEIEGKKCSSSVLRQYIKDGNIEEANKILIDPWEVEGRVVRGDSRGRDLGFPTANILYNRQMFPSDGIYAAWVYIEHNKTWNMAAVSSGIRPFFKGKKRILEAYLLGFSGNLYGKRIRVFFIKKIRPEKDFENIEKLIIQMKQDCIITEEVLKSYPVDRNIIRDI